MKKIYVTFTYPRQFLDVSRIAVECNTIAQAEEVAFDACCIAGIKQVRIRKSTRPFDRDIMLYEDFLEWV